MHENPEVSAYKIQRRFFEGLSETDFFSHQDKCISGFYDEEAQDLGCGGECDGEGDDGDEDNESDRDQSEEEDQSEDEKKRERRMQWSRIWLLKYHS